VCGELNHRLPPNTSLATAAMITVSHEPLLPVSSTTQTRPVSANHAFLTERLGA
jgi:hypothetical protein